VPIEVLDSLKCLGRSHGATLFMTLLAVVQTMLGRYSYQDDFGVGTAIANRACPETEDLIGLFVNTLVLRTDLSGDPSFTEILHRVRETALGAYAHQDVPFEQIVEELQPERDLSRNPLFQVLFQFLNAAPGELMLPGIKSESLSAADLLGTTKVDLELTIVETTDGLEGSFEYATDLFDASTITRMVGHFQTLLGAVIADPDRPISALEMLGADERHQLLVEWNDTAAPVPEACIHELVEAQVERTPTAPAVVFEGETLTYAELDIRANRLAQHLRALGVGPEVVVGICLERSLEMVVALLGVLKAGGAYLPLDPDYPSQRLSFMVDDAAIAVLLTQSHLLDVLPPSGATVVCLDAEATGIAERPASKPLTGVGARNLAYVIYTSGSTGTPKGVMVEHRGVVNLAHAQRAVFGLRSTDCVLQFASLGFDASVWELVMAFGVGARLCVMAGDRVLSGVLVVSVIERQGVTTATFPPSLLSVLPEDRLPSVRTIITAGEAAAENLVRRWSRDRQVFNAYGPTESTVCATCWPAKRGDDTVPIGRPIANTQIYILDEDLNPTPIGVPGEIYIGGVGLARGYLGRPELTAERFVPNPFGADGSRLYRTGDRGRWRPDANIEFLGRVDHQVKIRGHRIEPGEIEAALSQHPAVRETVVVAREDQPDQRRLVAYVVAQAMPTTTELRAHLRRSLPDYMVPEAFVTLEALPRTPNGKIDRRALPPPVGRPDLEQSFVAPRTPTEEVLADIWAEVLGVDRVGVHDDFFELGGHSLLATQMLSRIHELLAIEIPVSAIFDHPSIGALAAILTTTDSRHSLGTTPS
jgi:amino acid adenylation domain-containing protein